MCLQGSDHCPVYAVIKDTVDMDGNTVHIRDAMNPPGVFEKGQRRRDLSQKDMLPLSGKQIPEFAGRRSIKDMFFKKPSTQNGPETSRLERETTETVSQGSPAARMQSPGRPVAGVSASSRNGARDRSETHDHSKDSETHDHSKDSETQAHSRDADLELARKRSLQDASPKQALKRTRSSAVPASPTGPGRGQSSLTGFFKRKETADNGPVTATGRAVGIESSQSSDTTVGNNPGDTTVGNNPDVSGETPSLAAPPAVTRSADAPPLLDTESQADDAPSPVTDEFVHDPIESKESWSRLFTRRAAPLCESHAEPCRTMVTKKPGVNCGRSFWMCAKPLGPSGQKERGTEWRCPTFIWHSDWSGGSAA